MKRRTKREAFTLIEIMLVMILLAVLAVLLIGNFNTTLKRGRDAQRKNDLSQIQKALEMYYEDNKSYPTFTAIFNKKLCPGAVCAVGDTSYMTKTPNDPSSTNYTYVYYPAPTPVPSGISTYYFLYSYIENDKDQGPNVSIKGYINPNDASTTKCGVAPITVNCRYSVSSSNAPPLTPAP